MILDEVKEAYVKALLKKGKRPDERDFLEYRPIKIEKGLLPNAEGSALARIGDTKVLCGVKFDVFEPFPDRPDEGVFIVGSEFSPMAHPEFMPGPPNEHSIELSRVVDRGIRSAEVIDLAKLFREEGKVLAAFIDLYVLDHCGNLIDAAALAAMAALTTAKVPRHEDEALIRTEFEGPLPLARKVAACSFEKIDGQLILDATNQEEVASDGRLSISTCDGDLICAGQKSGRAGFSKKELLDLVDLAIEKGKELRELV